MAKKTHFFLVQVVTEKDIPNIRDVVVGRIHSLDGLAEPPRGVALEMPSGYQVPDDHPGEEPTVLGFKLTPPGKAPAFPGGTSGLLDAQG